MDVSATARSTRLRELDLAYVFERTGTSTEIPQNCVQVKWCIGEAVMCAFRRACTGVSRKKSMILRYARLPSMAHGEGATPCVTLGRACVGQPRRIRLHAFDAHSAVQ